MSYSEKDVIKLWQALRAGPMESEQITARFGYSVSPANLIKQGYVKVENGVFSITPLGLANCPTRRQPRNQPQTKAPIMQNTQPFNIVSHADTVAATRLTPEFKAVASNPVPATTTARITHEIEAQTTDKPKALRILEYIEANPGQTIHTITKATGIESPRAYITAQLNNKSVVLTKVAGKPAKYQTYALKPGVTAKDLYLTKSSAAQKRHHTSNPAPAQAPAVSAPSPVVSAITEVPGKQTSAPVAEPTNQKNPGNSPLPSIEQSIQALLQFLPQATSIEITKNDLAGKVIIYHDFKYYHPPIDAINSCFKAISTLNAHVSIVDQQPQPPQERPL